MDRGMKIEDNDREKERCMDGQTDGQSRGIKRRKWLREKKSERKGNS